MHLNNLVIGSSQVVATFIGFFFIKTTPRKPSMLIGWAIPTVLYLVLFFWVPCLEKDHCT